MFTASRFLGTLGVSGTLLLVTLNVVSAAGIEPSKPSQTVLLVPGSSLCPTAGKLVNMQIERDGVLAPFTIPAKQVLVITEVDWFLTGASASQAINVALSLQDPGGVVPAAGVFFDTALSDSTGQGGRVANISNLVVRPGPSLCLTSASGTQTVVIRGFLTKDK